MRSITKIILDRLDEEGIITDSILASNIINSTLAKYHIDTTANLPVTSTDLPEYIQTYLKTRQFDGLSKVLQSMTYVISSTTKVTITH